ncbi:MAG: heparin lyase I family protein [Gemmatimonadota bacterium]
MLVTVWSCGEVQDGPVSPVEGRLALAGGVRPSPVGAASGTVIFEDGFETGDFRRWSGMAEQGMACWEGRGAGGAHIGDGCVRSDVVKSGSRAWKAIVDPNEDNLLGQETMSKLERQRVTRGVYDFWVSAWYYFPANYPAVWSNIMQIKKAEVKPNSPLAVVVHDRNREFKLYAKGHGNVDQSNVRVPYGRWFNLTTHFVTRKDGKVEVFLDGKSILKALYDTIEDAPYMYFGVGNYLASAKASFLFVDDVQVTR